MNPQKDSRPQKRAKIIDEPLKSSLKSQKSPSASQWPLRKEEPTPTSVAFADHSSEPAVADAKAKNEDLATAARQEACSNSRNIKGKIQSKYREAQKNIRAYPTTFKVVAGTYERLLYGLEGSFIDEDGTPLEEPRLKPIFIFPAHVSCVKAVAVSPDGGKWLATGSTDEIIKVWDLRKRKEIGGLLQHEGSITQLSFPTRSHLISASEDGTISIFRTRDWILLRSLRGHKGRVNSVAAHPSGKVVLSVGKDRTLRMWDLIRGKGSASTKLGKEGELVRWSTGGDRFIIQSGSGIDVYATEMVLLHTITHGSRIHDILFFRDPFNDNGRELLFVAAEDKKITMYDTCGKESTSLPVVGEAIGHENRVKAMDVLAVAAPTSPRSILSTVSSDGWIRIFDLKGLSATDGNVSGKRISLTAVAEYDTKGSRLICCALADGEVPSPNIINKRKHRKGSSDSSSQRIEGEDEIEEDMLNENSTGITYNK